ncbi:MAG TPA: type VI secretion system tip protein TssI/VgrG [Anaeromyxobacteraceae bacterium]|jgi:type VI secretion system secreted protein VgrG
MADRTRTTIELRAGPLAEGDVAVARLRGREALSTPFAFDVEFRRRDGESVELGDLVAAEAQVAVRRTDGAERLAHGVVDAAELVGVRRGIPWYLLRIVPRLALLAHGADSRIFQAKSVPDIAGEVLDEGKVAHRLALRGSYPTREYCVQYRESDLAFVQRLLAEEGIFYFFEFADGEHTMVLGDAPDAFAGIEGDAQVPFRADAAGGESDEEHLFRLLRAERVRAERATRRDYHFLHPELDVTGAAAADRAGSEIYEYRLGAGDVAGAKRQAKLRLEEARAEAVEVEGEGTCLRLLPGRRLEVVDHPDATFNGKWQILRVDHEARQQEGAGALAEVAHDYRARLVACPDGTPVHAPGPRPRAVLPGTQTATAVGPAGEEIHVDEHGRIKVQFHWDRQGKRDDKSSCWVRVGQPWAGPGWGSSRIPRIGQEVVVRFLEGDPDQPLVVGAVYDGANPPPATLPADRTQSTLRSDSSPGGGGSNELRFEDLAGSEEVFLHAQKDENDAVEHDAEVSIGNDAALDVAQDRTIAVHRDQRLEVKRNDASRVKKDQTLTVGAARSTAVEGSHDEEVAGNQVVTVGGSQRTGVGVASTATIGAAAALTVGGAYAVSVGAAYNTAVGGARSLQVGGDEVLVARGSSEETVGASFDRKVGGDELASVEAGVAILVGADFSGTVSGKEGAEAKAETAFLAKKVRLEAEDELGLVVGGKLLLSLKKSGDVAIAASAFTAKADGDLKLKGGQVKMTAGDAAASKMLEVKALEKIRQARGTATVVLEDASGNPLRSVRFRAELPDGTVAEGVTDGSGAAAIPSAKEGDVKISFPDLDDDSWRTA